MKASLAKFLKLMTPSIGLGLLVILLGILLSGCQTKTVSKLNTSYYASLDLNPDLNARPSPLVVWVYQLKSLSSFQDLDYFALDTDAKLALGDALLFQEMIELRPNQILETETVLSPETQWVAFVASYRNIEAATWKAAVSCKSIRKKTLKVFLSSKAIEIKK